MSRLRSAVLHLATSRCGTQLWSAEAAAIAPREGHDGGGVRRGGRREKGFYLSYTSTGYTTPRPYKLWIRIPQGIFAPGPRAHNPAHRRFRAPRRPSRSSWCQRAAAGRALQDAAEPRRRGPLYSTIRNDTTLGVVLTDRLALSRPNRLRVNQSVDLSLGVAHFSQHLSRMLPQLR